ncbi:MAG: hypothetical protein OXG08_03200 [Gammaproteobacteria bacterium]|nr:hypothetical protein [Gammaproteobacteria bacterium]
MTDQTDGWNDRARKCAVGIRWRLASLVGLPLLLYTATYNIVRLFHQRNFAEVLDDLVRSLVFALVMGFLAAQWLRLVIWAKEKSLSEFISDTEASFHGVWTNPTKLSLSWCAGLSVVLFLIHVVEASLLGKPWQVSARLLTLSVTFVAALPICYVVTERLIRNVKQSLREVKTLSGE